ncbi:MAG: DUF5591 domain-containing protein, partial [Candidatus Hodarchaeota archaeon]
REHIELEDILNKFIFSEKIIKGFLCENIDLNSESFPNFLIKNNIKCLVSSKLSAVQFSSRHMLQTVMHLNSLPFPNISLYVPAIVPMNVPLLAYLGVDLFDTTACNIASQKGIYFLRNHSIYFDEIKEYPCLCLACQNQSDENWLREHNVNMMALRIQETRSAIIRGTLRELLRESAAQLPLVAEILRLIDKNHSSQLLVRTPINRKIQLICTNETDFIRPEVQNFRIRVKERYSPPNITELIIILPCSSKKPYSKSSSHLAFRRAIKEGLKGRRNFITEVIVTSPLGIVPRELEGVYPASHYDIPVTGDWNELERNRVMEDLHSYLHKFDSKTPILVHLSEPERSIVLESLNGFQWDGEIVFTQITGSPKTFESLISLKSKLQEILKGIPISKVRTISPQIKAFRAMADYLLGKKAGEVLFPEETVIKGKPEIMQRVFLEKKQLASYSRSKGSLSLNLAGAERIAHLQVPKVIFDGDTITGGSVFGPGLKDIVTPIQPGDSVIVLSSEGKIIGVGEAMISSFTMKKRQKGVAIKIRQKKREK